MPRKQVLIDGDEYVPVSMLAALAEPDSRTIASLIAAAIQTVRADEAIEEEGGLKHFDASFATLKESVEALEREADRQGA